LFLAVATPNPPSPAPDDSPEVAELKRQLHWAYLKIQVLEERLRLQTLAPAEWRPQIALLTEDQLIGLRFAPDEEVVALAKLALEEHLNRKQIKERIQNWRADNWRI